MKIHDVPSNEPPSAQITTDAADVWHQRQDHLDEASMIKLRNLPGAGTTFKGSMTPCKTCALRKSSQLKHPKTSTIKTSAPLELIYTDLAGSFKPSALDGSNYISKFTDHHTRFKAAYPIRSKIKPWKRLMPLGLRIQRLRCDKGGEYTANYYRDFCKETGIIQEFASTNTPQQNGISERDGRTTIYEYDTLFTNRRRFTQVSLGRNMSNSNIFNQLITTQCTRRTNAILTTIW